MIGYHITTICIANSKGDICQGAGDRYAYLDWLLDDHPDEEPKVFYDLDASVAALLKLMGIGKHDAERLSRNRKLYMAPYRLTYYPGRFFSIDRGFGPEHPYVNFSNMGQYTDVHFEPEPSPQYAVKKAREAEEIGQEVARAFKRLGLDDKRLTSPIGAFDRSHSKATDIPTLDDIPVEAAEIAYGCVKGNWLEAYQLGYWKEAYDYDISGAYGSELAKLLDLRRGRWLRTPNCPNGAAYGFAKGNITCWADFHPFLLNVSEDMTYTPVGTWPTNLTMQEIAFLEKWNLGKFEIEDAWWWIPEGKQNELLKGMIKWLWEKRRNTEEIDNKVVKRIMAGIWGRTLEVRGTEAEPEFGPHVNPVYGAIVESNTRLRVADTCLEHCIVPLHVAVDGMILDKLVPIDGTGGLGDWRLSHVGQCIIASSGVVAFEGKAGAEEFSLRFSWLQDQMERYPRDREYEMRKYSPCSLARALNTDFDKLGMIEEITRSVAIGGESKRMWRDHPRNGGDLLKRKFQSAPWEYGVIKQEIQV